MKRALKVSSYDTVPALLPKEGLIRMSLSSQFGNNRYLLNGSSDNIKTLKHVSLSNDTLKIKSKIRNIVYNSAGTRVYVVTRDHIYLLNVQNLTLEHTISVKCINLIAHPKHPDTFALLLQSVSGACSTLKIYEIRKGVRYEIDLCCVITSAFEAGWYAGSWSPDGFEIAVVDRSDVLQVAKLKDGMTQLNMSADDSIKLDSEVYGLMYTEELLIVQRVDGNLQIFHRDLKDFYIERAHSHIVTALAYNKNKNVIATGGSDHIVNIFDIESDMTCIGTFPRLEGQISSLSFSNDGVFLAWGTKDSASLPIDDTNTLGTDITNEHNFNEYSLTIASINPCEIYYSHNTPSSVTHVTFSPIKYVVAYACDYDAFKTNNHGTHQNIVGFLHLS